VTDNAKTYRFAATGPWYVEFANQPRRVSKESAAFFAAWVAERIGNIILEDETQRREVLEHHERALEYWRDLESKANAP
jgi:hypothetical protein